MAQERLAQLLQVLAGMPAENPPLPPSPDLTDQMGPPFTRRNPHQPPIPPEALAATGALQTREQALAEAPFPIPRHVQMGAPWSDFEESPEQLLSFTQPGGQLGELLSAQATQEVMEDLPESIEQRTAELQLEQVKEKRAQEKKMRKQLQTLGRK